MGEDASSPTHTRAQSDTYDVHAALLSPESAAILAQVFCAIRSTPHLDPRPVFEEVVAQRAGVTSVCLRPMELSRPLVRDPRQHQPVTIAANGKIYVLDADAHSHAQARDPDRVTHVLQAAAPLVPAVLNAPAPRRGPFRHRGHHAGDFDEYRDRLIGSSELMQRLREEIKVVACTDFGVIIEGETGVGKELVARHIHAGSDRARGPFVPVNCAALVESLFESELFGIEDGVATGVRGHPGKFELAHGGTLFLDEIAELQPAGQAKLLRIVQNNMVDRVGSNTMRHANVRLMVATNRSLRMLMEEGQFRRDLFFRLKSLHMCVPPLRDHREDIPDIAQAYLRRCQPLHPPQLTPLAAEVLALHDWPGNVRELERAMEHAIAHAAGAPEIHCEHLARDLGQPYRDLLRPAQLSDQSDRGDLSMRAMKKRYARFMFHQCGRNKRKTCDALGISYHTLMAYLEYEETEDGQDDDTEEGGEVPEPDEA
jgi:two-component system response regulator HydG